MSNIKRKGEDGAYTSMQPNQKRKKSADKYGNIDEASLTWFRNVRESKVSINGIILMGKLEQLSIGMHVKTPSRTWLQKWELHHNIAYVKLHGEAGSADVTAADKWINIGIPRILADYEEKDIHNADETGLYYKCLPTFTFDIIKKHNDSDLKWTNQELPYC